MLEMSIKWVRALCTANLPQRLIALLLHFVRGKAREGYLPNFANDSEKQYQIFHRLNDVKGKPMINRIVLIEWLYKRLTFYGLRHALNAEDVVW